MGVVGAQVVLMGNVIPREAGAADGATGPVMIGKEMPRFPGVEEKEARHEVVIFDCLHVQALGCGCYVLKAPLLFPLHLILILPLIPGICPHLPLLLFLSSPMLFPLTLLIFFHALPQNLSA